MSIERSQEEQVASSVARKVTFQENVHNKKVEPSLEALVASNVEKKVIFQESVHPKKAELNQDLLLALNAVKKAISQENVPTKKILERDNDLTRTTKTVDTKDRKEMMMKTQKINGIECKQDYLYKILFKNTLLLNCQL